MAAEVVAAAAIGIALFVLTVGTAVLDPRNIRWMAAGDAAQYYLGWSFFRRSGWAWPPSLNPDYGLEIASTIFFADVVPGAALLSKLAGAPATGPWQYHGLWLLLCFALQAVFAWRLAALFLSSRLQCALIAALACLSPVFMRVLFQSGHYALSGQWTVLAALLLCVRPPTHRQGVLWGLLVALAALVHSYLFVMVFALWASDLVRRYWLWRLVRPVAAEAVGVVLLGFGALWLAGFRLLPGGGLAQGQLFGTYRAHLATFFDSEGWSRLWPDIASRASDIEGSAFLGLAGLALAIAAAFSILLRRPLTRDAPAIWPAAVAALGLCLFALSNQIAIGRVELVEVPLPGRVMVAAEMLRASGRMTWPLHYLLLLGAAIAVARRLPRAIGTAVLALAVVVQFADTAPARTQHGERLRQVGSSWPSPLVDPFWEDLAPAYKRLRRIPATSHGPHWEWLSYYALTHDMATDAVYLARFAGREHMALLAKGEQELASGRFDPDTLYVLDDASARLAAASIDRSRDLLVELDGLNVLAPGWLRSRQAPDLPLAGGQSEGAPVRPPLLRQGAPLVFTGGSAGVAALRDGWSAPEAWGTWSDGNLAFLAMRLPAGTGGVELSMLVQGFIDPANPRQRAIVSSGGVRLAEWIFDTSANRGTRDLFVPPEVLRPVEGRQREIVLQLELPDARETDPDAAAPNRRRLGLALFSISLRPRPEQ
ncbi:DUF6311 domain-containing protein [Falsiroseomonas oryzae]|uniref:DUF6311 domain-containing protein n=1 Tax=Falsiroseomonas oryzae TaxID=2766473 RepID=UPI0022EA6D40|nr:DUF6311 domain-containing protein [Roseomonas sp. MO-31]